MPGQARPQPTRWQAPQPPLPPPARQPPHQPAHPGAPGPAGDGGNAAVIAAHARHAAARRCGGRGPTASGHWSPPPTGLRGVTAMGLPDPGDGGTPGRAAAGTVRASKPVEPAICGKIGTNPSEPQAPPGGRPPSTVVRPSRQGSTPRAARAGRRAAARPRGGSFLGATAARRRRRSSGQAHDRAARPRHPTAAGPRFTQANRAFRIFPY